MRKIALTAHVVSSVGWLGALAGFLALAVGAFASEEPQTVRAAYLAMEVTGWFVLVPLSLASLLTGLVQSLGTNWGLLRHWWVAMKLIITMLATTVLLVYTRTLGELAGVARDTPAGAGLGGLPSPSPVLHAGAGLALLLVATVLAIFKPPGLTGYGRRARRSGP